MRDREARTPSADTEEVPANAYPQPSQWTHRWAQARRAVELALQHRPGNRQLRFERALILEQQGLLEESLEELEQLASEGEESPQFTARLARELHLASRGAEAEAKVEDALRRWPTDGQLHSVLVRLRWLHGHGERATMWLERAIHQYPKALHLRLIAADALRHAGYPEKALALLQGGRRIAPDSVGFLTSIGVVLESLDRPIEALDYLRAALSRAPDSVPARRNLIPTLLRLSATAEALALCDQLLAQAPNDQQLIAYRATALRMRGDPGYGALHDYDRLVRVYRLPPPPGFPGIDAFNLHLATELLRLHRQEQRPLEQSLRGGTQTDRNLPRDQPVIRAFFDTIDAPIQDYISRLREGSDHPTDRRKSAAYRIAGSWSVNLRPGGFHLNHVHPQGWLSSAYYVSVPAQIEEKPAGWLKFAEPGMPIPGCPADLFVKPQAGTLVLFPAYMWHGTVPFNEGGHRLTAAFDVVPA